MSHYIGPENRKLMKAVIDRKILPPISETLKILRSGESTEKTIEHLNIPKIADEMMPPLMNGDLFRSMKEVHALSLIHGLIMLKYASDHPEEFDMEKLVEETNSSMKKEGWL
jgi:hypothetical protein